jgi:hypothetical protein
MNNNENLFAKNGLEKIFIHPTNPKIIIFFYSQLFF